ERVMLLHYREHDFLFESNTHWWLSQLMTMGDEWLQDLFGDSRDYHVSDFSGLYRTFLNIYGGKTDNDLQYMATLSRLIYGLSSAYLLLGDIRFLKAAKAGVDFQRTAFRSITHDGQHIIWSHARKKLVIGNKTIIPSQMDDDRDSIPLYEQIYALAGMTQYFRITGDGEVLNDIIRTVKSFNKFYKDDRAINPDYPGNGGYFSHIDPVTFVPYDPALGKNRLKKNWNSIGDHIPAYLINIILALEPLPVGNDAEIEEFLQTCKKMLDELTSLILEKFPDPDRSCPYVNERFYDDWRPDHEWGWQQNRAIVGHNLKIVWNLLRIAHYYSHKSDRATDVRRIREFAERLGTDMKDAGLDLYRGGCFDAVERNRREGHPIELVWGDHKDFWQQEQGILAYLSLFGFTGEQIYLDLARDMMAWWNAFHLDRENRSILFRIDDNGSPIVKGRGIAGYDIAGYHAFELNYLAHIYIRCFTDRRSDHEVDFCLYFRPDTHSVFNFINVLPDFLKPGTVEIAGITVNGKTRDYVAADNFQIPVNDDELGKEFIIQFRVIKKPADREAR
ncbi:MAG: AGE family epimerase/isomerase, partial [Methanospirillum sp.]|nr:AGE family epimerase/isomerase [Methanospirillum sp.]